MGIESDAPVLARLAIFPLPDVVVFPGTVLPLHVFEPRYVAMTRDVMAGSRHMGIARLCPGYEETYLGRPPIVPIMGLGEVIACEELPGDRFAIAVRGAGRVQVERELPPERAYREVVATALPDLEFDEAALAVERAQLAAVCERLAEGIGVQGEWLREIVRTGAGTAELTHVLASALVLEPDRRQAIFELRHPGARLAELLEHASRLLALRGPAPSAAN
jgi:Lon protease-like protein